MATKVVPIFLPKDRMAWIGAGPTRELPDNRLLIRCAAEIKVPPVVIAADVSVHDFKPFDDEVVLEALPGIMAALRGGMRLYVGCMGGTGRTGTMLAILAGQHPDVSGEDAIRYIRSVYKPGAIETPEQEAQVIRLSERKFITAETRAWPSEDKKEPQRKSWWKRWFMGG